MSSLALSAGAFLGGASAPSSYMRSGSNAPSRAHSPLGHAGAHYPGMQPYPHPPTADMSSLMVAAGVALGGLGIPSYMDLERHYIELSAHKRKWEEMIEKTERLMAGMKRAMDEMRGLAAQQAPPTHHLMMSGMGMPTLIPTPTGVPSPAVPQPLTVGSPVAPGGSSSKLPSPTHPTQHPGSKAASPTLLTATSPLATAPVPLQKPATGERERNPVWPIVEPPPRTE